MARPRSRKPAVFLMKMHVPGCAKGACDCPRDDLYTYSFRYYETSSDGAWVSKQYTRRTRWTTLKDAKAEAMMAMRDKEEAMRAGRRAFVDGDESRMRRVLGTIGEIGPAYLARCGVWRKSCRGKDGSFGVHTANAAARRSVTDLALFVALARDLWVVNEGGRQGKKVGALVPDLERINKVSCGVLSEAGVRAYQLARQKSYGIVPADATEVDVTEHERNVGINSTLRNVWDLFSADALKHCYAGRVVLPDLATFKDEDLLLLEPEELREPEPFVGSVFDELCAAFDALRDSEPELWKLNVFMRQTILRPAFVLALTRENLVMVDDHASLAIYSKAHSSEVRGTPSMYVPLTEELREVMLAVPKGARVIGEGWTAAALVDLQDRHNAIIKRIAGGRKYGQGAYRFRDTGGSVLMREGGVKVARDALGHRSSDTTLDHYARALPAVSARQRQELRAWLRG